MFVWLRKLYAPRRASGTKEDKMADYTRVNIDSAGCMSLGDSNGNEIFRVSGNKVEILEGLEVSQAALMLLDGLQLLIAMARDTGYVEGYNNALKEQKGE